MTTAAELKAAYKTIVRSELSDEDANAIAAAGQTIDSYIAALFAQTASTTGAAFAMVGFITGLAPTADQLTRLKAEAEVQFASYAKLGVADPDLGPFEAFGRSLAVDPMTRDVFAAKYGALSTADFVNKIYGELYCSEITAGAFANLSAQVAFFTEMLGRANVPDAELAAKGAALGQLIGYAFLDGEAAKTAIIDDQVRLALTSAVKGDETIYDKALPFVAKPCDVEPDPSPAGPTNPGDATPTDSTPPVFTSSDQATMVENTPAATIVYQAIATDPSGPITYTLAGIDNALFTIDAATGAVRFAASPDFEDPKDDGKDNVYNISVVATDTVGNAAMKPVTINVTDAVEAPGIWRASVDSSGAQAAGASGGAAISANGRYVAFASTAANLVAGDTNGKSDVFVHDNVAKTTTRISVDGAGAQGNGDSFQPSLSADGRYVAFRSLASNLVAGDTNNQSDIFIHDTQTAQTTRINTGPGGVQGNAISDWPRISADGNFVVYQSRASNLVAGDTAGKDDLFLYDVQNTTTTRISVGVGGQEANLGSYSPAISADGSFVVFQGLASNLVAGDTNGGADFFVYNRATNDIARINVTQLGQQTSGAGIYSAMSGDGRFITFASRAADLVAGDANNVADIFRLDRNDGSIVRVSVDDAGVEANKASFNSAISGDGRYVAFFSDATNLVPNDTNGSYDIFVRDVTLSKTYRVSVNDNGEQGVNGASLADSDFVEMSSNGRYLTFRSQAVNLVADDTNGARDIFVVDGLAQGWWFP